MGYMRIQNVHCNWLAKNVTWVHIEVISGRHPANTRHEFVVSRESSTTSTSVAFIFFTVGEHLMEWTYGIGCNIPCFFPGSGEIIPLLHQGRSADFHSSDQVDWMFYL